MGLLTKVFGSGTKAVSDAVVDTAKGVSEIVERWAPSAEARHEMSVELQKLANDAADSARRYDPRSTATTKIGELINVLADAVNRSIRPGVTIGLIGGVMGWWALPAPNQIDPVFLGWTENVVIFWFGGRMLFKDLPSVIGYVASLRKK